MRVALFWSGCFWLLGLVTFDGGDLLLHLMAAITVFWFAVSYILLRRPDVPAKGDLSFIRYGVPLSCLLTMIIVGLRK
jgi:hypothetical protein